MTTFMSCSISRMVRPSSARSRRIRSRQRGRLLRVHARGRLVQQQQRRLGGQRPRDLQAALIAVRQVARPGLVRRRRGRRSRAARARARAPGAPRASTLGRREHRIERVRLQPRVHARPARCRARSSWRTGGCSGRSGRCPSWVISCGLRPTSRSPWKMISPLVGRYRPAIMLKKVVLPAPFGPIRLTIERSSIAKSTSLTATRPPKRLVDLASLEHQSASRLVATPPIGRSISAPRARRTGCLGYRRCCSSALRWALGKMPSGASSISSTSAMPKIINFELHRSTAPGTG